MTTKTNIVAKTKNTEEKINNHISKVYTRGIDSLGRGYGTGRGKGHSVAKVWAKYNGSNTTNISVNGGTALDYFRRESLVHQIQGVLGSAFADSEGVVGVDVRVDTFGGGKSGQARAARLGLARALVVLNGSLKETLRGAGCLTRDSRVPERMKPGQPGARAQYPYNRR